MFRDIEEGIGLDIVLAIQDSRNDVFDVIAEALHFMGTDVFFILFLPLIYWSVNRRLGIRLLFALMFVGITSALLKEIFQRPRPFQVSNEVDMWITQDGYGLPSGHVMNIIIIWGYLAFELQKRWLYWLVGILVILMGWARMYLGVHYPQDVIGGLILGAIGFWVYCWMVEHVPKLWVRLKLQPQLATIVLIVITFPTFLIGDDIAMALVGLLVGVSIGWILNDAYDIAFQADGHTSIRVMRYLIGIALLGVVFGGLRILSDGLVDEGSTLEAVLRVPRYAVIGLFGFTGYPYLALRLGLLSKEQVKVQPGGRISKLSSP